MDITEVAEIAPLLEEMFAEEFGLLTSGEPGTRQRGEGCGAAVMTCGMVRGRCISYRRLPASGVDGMLDSVLVALESVEEDEYAPFGHERHHTG